MRKILLIVGPQRSGKTETAELIGLGRIVHCDTFNSLFSMFGLSRLLNPKVLILEELPSELYKFESTLIALATGKEVAVSRMGQEDMSRSFDLTVLLVSNHTPRFTPYFREHITILKTGGVYDR